MTPTDETDVRVRRWLLRAAVVLVVLDALDLAAVVGLWLACIWTTGNDPLSVQLGQTALVAGILAFPLTFGAAAGLAVGSDA